MTAPQNEPAKAAWKAARRLELVVGARNGDPRFYELALRDPGDAWRQPRTGSAVSEDTWRLIVK